MATSNKILEELLDVNSEQLTVNRVVEGATILEVNILKLHFSYSARRCAETGRIYGTTTTTMAKTEDAAKQPSIFYCLITPSWLISIKYVSEQVAADHCGPTVACQ